MNTPQPKMQRKPFAEIMGIRDLPERRERIAKMYDMLHGISREPDAYRGTILGEGFYIRHVVESPDGLRKNEYYVVYRRGLGVELVKHLVRVAAMFTPEMFCNGIGIDATPRPQHQ